jgi:L-asparagine oxygenase
MQLVDSLTRRLTSGEADLADDGDWVARARRVWHDFPVDVRRRISDFRRDSGPNGALLLSGFPTDEVSLPLTPLVSGSVQRVATPQAALLMCIASGLGDPASFLAEKSGALVQDVVPVPGRESLQSNEGSATVLTMHTENAFHRHRPDYVMLLCLRADPEGMAGLRTASARRVVPLLSDTTRQILGRPDFATLAPPSFGLQDAAGGRHAVLTGDPADPDLCVDISATRPLTPDAVNAMEELGHTLDTMATVIPFQPGDLAVLDNRIAVHGRTAFRPRYDGTDRWLQRSYVLSDLRRSRDHRPGDGYVLVR